MKEKITYNGETLRLVRKLYFGGALAVEVITDIEPYARVSTNIPNVSENLPAGEFVLNHDLNDEFFSTLRAEFLREWFEDTGKTCDYGMVSGQPIWRLRETADVTE